MQARTLSVALTSSEPLIVEFHAQTVSAAPSASDRRPRISRETRDRVYAGTRNSGHALGDCFVDVMCSTSAADPALDLAAAAAVLLATGAAPIPRLLSTVYFGQIALDGRVRPVPGISERAIAASSAGATHLVVPVADAAEVSRATEASIVAVRHITDLVAWLNHSSMPATAGTASIGAASAHTFRALCRAGGQASLPPADARATAMFILATNPHAAGADLVRQYDALRQRAWWDEHARDLINYYRSRVPFRERP